MATWTCAPQKLLSLSLSCYAFYLYLLAFEFRPLGGLSQVGQNTEADAAGRSGNARALRKKSECDMIQEGVRHAIPAQNSKKCLPWNGVKIYA